MSSPQPSLLLKGVRVFDPGAGIDIQNAFALLSEGRLRILDEATAGDRVVDAGHLVLVPGLIDLRSQLGEPGFTRREDVKTGLAAAAAGGFTSVVAMPTTEPSVDRTEIVELIQTRAEAAQGARVLVAGALSVGRAGERLAEMGKLAAAGCVAFTDVDRAVRDSQLLRYALETAKDLNLLIITHAEDEFLSLGGQMHEGAVSARLGLAGIPGAAEVVGVARDIALAELTGCRLHLGHIASAAAIELIRQAKRRGIRVTAEATPFHMVLNESEVAGYDSRAKMFPPLRPQSDADAVVAGLADGTLDAVASDHCPQTELDKNETFDRAAAGAISLQTTLSVVLSCVDKKQLTLQRAIALLTRGPGQVLGRRDLGRLLEGVLADFTVVDCDRVWRFDEASNRSRSRNSPFFGREFKGQAVLTVAGGRITHDLLD